MVADHLEPCHLGFVEFFTGSGVAGHDPVLEIPADGIVEGGEVGIDAARPADERDEGEEFIDWLFALVVVELPVGFPDAERGNARRVRAEPGHDGFQHREREFAAAKWLVKEDREGGELVLVCRQPVGEILCKGFGILPGVLVPSGLGELVEVLVI